MGVGAADLAERRVPWAAQLGSMVLVAEVAAVVARPAPREELALTGL